MSNDTNTDPDADTSNDTPAASEPHNPDYASDDDVVGLEETTLQRDSETGELQPRKVFVRELGGAVVAKPLTRDEREKYIENLHDEEHEKEELTDAELAELFDRKIVTPDLSQHDMCGDRVTEKFVTEGLTKTQEDGYYIAILIASGEDDLVRIFRGEYKDSEIKMAAAQSGNWTPQNNRDDNEVRRDRRDR